MKKIHLLLTIGLTLFLTSVCAEKYEYVHLKGKTESIGSVAWYYMKSINNEVYVWNANLPDGGWTKFRG
jgi:hypothetical protein